VRALASVNVAAIERNVASLKRHAEKSILCAVVKGNGYGHGSTAAAYASIAGGATWLAVATASEAKSLRADGIDAPVLVMGALTDAELQLALSAGADVVVWSEEFLSRAAALGGARLHVKLDTGMGRLGTRDPKLATQLVADAAGDARCDLVGLMTHFATADERDDEFFGQQLARFSNWTDKAMQLQPGLLRHAANSAALLRDEASQFDMVRPGIACYGLDPFGVGAAEQGLEPALSLHSYVAAIDDCAPGESVGYGRTFIAEKQTRIATVPIGYGDGWVRRFSNNADLLIAGKRYPVVGNVSMDNVTVDLGMDSVEIGAPVTLIGADGDQLIDAEELAQRAATINYEIVTVISDRVKRRYHRDGLELDGEG
jgi:alanine racemase